MNLVVNELFRYKGIEDKNNIERILWIDKENTYAVTINILEKTALPIVKNIPLLVGQIESGEIEKLSEDPFYKIIDDEKLNKKTISLREQAWGLICDAVMSEPDIYYREERGKLIRKLMAERGVTKRLIYKYLRKYWQRGKNKNTLLPDYFNSGGKGKSKNVGDKKIGRPRKNPDIQGVGFNVDESTKRVFRVAINQYYYTSKKNPLSTTYELMIKNLYTEDFKFEDGIKKPIIMSLEAIPTFAQFRYWFSKEQDFEKAIKSRVGKKNYELKYRQIIGKSDTEIMGPGSKYQVDATVADVYLKSGYNNDWIIGRPVVYVVIDVFSRMIAGMYVGLEGPSWLGAMMAFANAACDKVRFCSEYGINITEEDWPCHYLPESILADRGEVEGKTINTLVNSLHVKVENTPPFRADWKGIVEQSFRTINIKVKPFVPGFIDIDFRQRGGHDYRLDSQLTIYEFTQIIIRCVLNHNNRHLMDNYSRDAAMISDDVKSIPKDLWNWGIRNRSGSLRAVSEDIVKLNLMPIANVTVTEKGLRFKNMYYSCDKALSERWFERARNKGSWKEEISYDPRNMDFIYIRLDEGRNFEKCYMLDKSKYGGKTLDEIIYLDEYEKFIKQRNANESMQSKADLYAEIEDIVSKSKDKSKRKSNISISKTAMVKGIRDNRKKEKYSNRKKEYFELEKPEGEKAGLNNGEIINIDRKTYVLDEYDDEMEYLIKKQKERMEKKDE